MPLKTKIIALLSGAGMLAISAAAFATEPGDIKIVDDGVPMALTSQAGDAAKGKKIVANRKQGNCLACHGINDLANQPFHGDVGPELNGIAGRYDDAQLRLILVNAKVPFEGTIMPAFYRKDGLSRVNKKFADKTILNAQQVEDVLAYLKTLKEE